MCAYTVKRRYRQVSRCSKKTLLEQLVLQSLQSIWFITRKKVFFFRRLPIKEVILWHSLQPESKPLSSHLETSVLITTLLRHCFHIFIIYSILGRWMSDAYIICSHFFSWLGKDRPSAHIKLFRLFQFPSDNPIVFVLLVALAAAEIQTTAL